MDRDAEVIEKFANGMRRGNSAGAPGEPLSVKLIRGTELRPEPVKWLWKDWLALGKLHIIAGAPGTGKTSVAMALAATVTSAGRWPDGARAAGGNVLVWSGEDDPKDTLLPRLLAMGAERDRVYFVGDVLADGVTRPFDPSRDMDALTRQAMGIGDIRLLIIDPIVNAVAGDSHNNAETRRSLQPVVELASQLGAAVLGVSHFSKGSTGRDPVERVTGSIAFGALPRVIFAVAKTTEDDGTTTRLFVRSKSNIGPDGGGFNYDLEQTAVPGFPELVASRVLWGRTLEGEARELLAVAETVDNDEDRSATDEAMDWLRDELKDGPKKAGEVQSEAKKAGLSDKALRRAREKLGIKPKRREFSGGWWWTLTGVEDAQGAQDPQDAHADLSENGGILGNRGHLGSEDSEVEEVSV